MVTAEFPISNKICFTHNVDHFKAMKEKKFRGTILPKVLNKLLFASITNAIMESSLFKPLILIVSMN